MTNQISKKRKKNTMNLYMHYCSFHLNIKYHASSHKKKHVFKRANNWSRRSLKKIVNKIKTKQQTTLKSSWTDLMNGSKTISVVAQRNQFRFLYHFLCKLVENLKDELCFKIGISRSHALSLALMTKA